MNKANDGKEEGVNKDRSSRPNEQSDTYEDVAREYFDWIENSEIASKEVYAVRLKALLNQAHQRGKAEGIEESLEVVEKNMRECNESLGICHKVDARAIRAKAEEGSREEPQVDAGK